MSLIRSWIVLASASSLAISWRSLTSLQVNNTIETQSDKHRFAQENMADTNHRCGTYKCFYPLAAHDDAKQFGYVAGTDPSLEHSLWTAYNFSIAVIENEFGMMHTSLSDSPPEVVPLSLVDFVAWLDHNKTGTNDQPRDDVPQFAGHDQAFVQLVSQIGESALFWGTSPNKNAVGMSRLENWQRQHHQSLQDDPVAREAAMRAFEDNEHKLFQLLKAHPCLYDDFQILIQLSGEIVHIDIDRCFWFAEDGRAHEKDIQTETIVERQAMVQAFVGKVKASMKDPNFVEDIS